MLSDQIMSTPSTRTIQILENLNIITVLLSSDLRILYANPAAEMFFSTSYDRMLNRPIQDIVNFHDSLNKINQAIYSGQTFTEREVLVDIQNQEKTIDLSISPLSNKNKIKELLLEIAPQDRHIKITREEALFTQQQVSRELLRSMAHEVKNPLGGIRGAAQLLEQELKLLHTDELTEYTQIIINEADRLKNLVDRMSAPTTKSEKNWVNIHEICERVRSVMSNDKSLNIPIHFDYDPSIPDILADGEQLIQSLLNIVRNAAQAITECIDCKIKIITLKTRIVRHYTIGPAYHNLVLKLDIIDTGPGINADLLEHIFLPLITGRAAGTGLGLSIAQSLINQNNGLIECESEPGKTVFTVLLPIDSNRSRR